MDTQLARAKRAFYAAPDIETLERYAIEAIRAGLKTAWGPGYYLTQTMAAMSTLEMERRLSMGMTGPNTIPLWFDLEDFRMFGGVMGYQYTNPETQIVYILI